MKLTEKLSTQQFFISQVLILIIGLIFLFGLYYILNIQYRQSANPFLNGPVTGKPSSFKLDLDQPGDETLSYNASILVSGKTGPNMEVLISTDTDDQIIEAKSNGSFSITLSLSEGVNNIKVVTFDQTGDMREANRTVYYTKEKLQ